MLYFLSSSLCCSSLLISPLKMFMCFLTLFISLLILFFHQCLDSFLFLPPQALRPIFFPTQTITAFIRIFASAIFSILIYFNVQFFFLDNLASKDLSILLKPLRYILQLSFIKSNISCILVFSSSPKLSVSTWVASFSCIFSSS